MMNREQMEQRVLVLGLARQGVFAEQKALYELAKVQAVHIEAQKQRVESQLGVLQDEISLLSNQLLQDVYHISPGDTLMVTPAAHQWIGLNRSWNKDGYKVDAFVTVSSYDATDEMVMIKTSPGGYGEIPLHLALDMRTAWETVNDNLLK